MIRTAKEIYIRVNEKSDYSLEDIQSIGDTVFQELRSCLNNPRELAYEVPELGTFNARFKKYEGLFKVMKRKEEQSYHDVAFMIDLMTKYREDKARIKELRHGKNQTDESSEDNDQEH